VYVEWRNLSLLVHAWSEESFKGNRLHSNSSTLTNLKQKPTNISWCLCLTILYYGNYTYVKKKNICIDLEEDNLCFYWLLPCF